MSILYRFRLYRIIYRSINPMFIKWMNVMYCNLVKGASKSTQIRVLCFVIRCTVVDYLVNTPYHFI